MPLAPALAGIQIVVEDDFINDKEDSIMVKALMTLPAVNSHSNLS